MTAYVRLVNQNPSSQFCTFYIDNCGRSSYDGIQYRYVNNSTGYSSGWYDISYLYVYWNGSSGYTSEFDISLSPNYTYSVYTRMMVGSTWYNGDSYYEPVTFFFGAPPTDRVSMVHHSSNGRTINMQVLNAYGATTIDWKTPFGNYSRSVQSTPYTESFTAPSYGTEYVIGAVGRNSAGSVGEKLANTMTEPATPSINSGGSADNTITINVNPTGGWTTIEVEMWTIDATSRLAIKTQGWNGGSSFNVQFGGLVANASYLFRTRASKTASYGGYSPTTAWGGWLTVKNESTKPTHWKWTTAQNSNGHKISGAQFSMLATEWNSFTQRINAVRKYKNLSNYSFTTVSRGGTFYFYLFNEANTAIGAMNSTGLANVTRGDKVYASYFNALMNALNNIT